MPLRLRLKQLPIKQQLQPPIYSVTIGRQAPVRHHGTRALRMLWTMQQAAERVGMPTRTCVTLLR